MLGQYRDRQFETLRSLLFISITSIASDLHTDGPVYEQVWRRVAEPGPTLNWRSRQPLIGPHRAGAVVRSCRGVSRPSETPVRISRIEVSIWLETVVTASLEPDVFCGSQSCFRGIKTAEHVQKGPTFCDLLQIYVYRLARCPLLARPQISSSVRVVSTNSIGMPALSITATRYPSIGSYGPSSTM